MDRHRILWDRRHLAMRLDAPAFSNAITAGREGEERRQFDDFRVAVEFLQLLVYLPVPSIVERESARVVQSSASLRVRVFPVWQRAAHFLLFGNGRRERRRLSRAELAPNHLGDLDTRKLL